MRWGVLIGLGMVTMAAGCPLDSSLDGDSYLLVVESATLSAMPPGGASWCPSPLETRVSATVDGVTNETPVGTGLTPRFESGLLDAPAADFAGGVRITLLGRCDGTTFTIGSLWVRPPVDDIRAGTLFLVAVGPDALVRMRFEPSSFGVPGDDLGVPGDDVGDDVGDPGDAEPPPDDCSDGTCVWLDPGDPPPDTMDPGDDPGDDGGWTDPGDDGGGDCGCDEGGGDDGGGDDGGGDDGGGGDGGGDGFVKLPIIWKLLPNPAATTTH